MSKQSLVCIECGSHYPVNKIRYFCDCSGLLEVRQKDEILKNIDTKIFDDRLSSFKPYDQSGVWRFREAILDIPVDEIKTHKEGRTSLYESKKINAFCTHDNLLIKHEGQNPSGSFKDRGMTVAVSQAVRLNVKRLACASTGNTSSSLAAYAALAGLESFVFLPDGKISSGKLAQALGYGAKCLAVNGDFDEAMSYVKELAKEQLIYMVNSLNPFRLEGQKSIIWDILQELRWKSPDWIIVPGGNLGNTSAFGKAINEAYRAGWIHKKPRLACIQAAGANPFYAAFREDFKSFNPVKAETIATAIRIGNPVNYTKAIKVIKETGGLVSQVEEQEILDAKAQIDSAGIGCEPASACSVAGLKKLKAEGTIKSEEVVVCILTGNILKDPEIVMHHNSGSFTKVESDYNSIKNLL